jgi:hypothetical protein
MPIGRIVGSVVIAVAVGVGAAVLGPGLARAVRPALRKAMTRAITLAREGQVFVEGAWEDFEDLLAEAQADSERGSAPAASHGPPFAGQASMPKTEGPADA